MSKQAAIVVKGSVITAETAKGYLTRAVRFLTGERYDGSLFHSFMVLADIESKIVAAGFMDWEEVEAVEIEAMSEQEAA